MYISALSAYVNDYKKKERLKLSWELFTLYYIQQIYFRITIYSLIGKFSGKLQRLRTTMKKKKIFILKLPKDNRKIKLTLITVQ